MLPFVVFVLAWASAMPTGVAGKDDPHAIYGGDEVDPGTWPSVVAIYGPNQCSGVLVAPRLVMTAAHCLAGLAPDAGFLVVFGEDTGHPTRLVQSAGYGFHPWYCPVGVCRQGFFDFGYVLLQDPVTVPGGFPLLLTEQSDWNAAMGEGSDIVLIGYGQAEDDVEFGIKRDVTATIRRVLSLGHEFIAGSEGKDSCQGDSGGPAFVRGADGRIRIVGITSAGFDCGDGGFLGVPYEALCWIRDSVGIDLVPPDCEDCDCLDTRAPIPVDNGDIEPPADPQDYLECRVGHHHGSSAWWMTLSLLSWRRRESKLAGISVAGKPELP